MADRSSTAVSAASSEREKAIDLALQQIERRFGKGAIMKLGDASHIQVEVIPTGSIALDLALGIGGVPRGRITEIYGPEASGKTTLCQHIIASAQRAGGFAAFIDAEHALDRTYAGRCGVDTNNLLISQPDTGEQALVIFTNQLREKVGVMFGNPETTSGGKALKFYASVRLDIRRIDSIKQGQDVVGSRTRVKVVKNKVAPPFRVAEFDIMYSEGISREGGFIDLGLEMGLVKKSGAWFTVGDIRLGQGRENAKEFLRQNTDVASAIEEQIRGNIVSFRAGEVEGKEEEEDNLDEEL